MNKIITILVLVITLFSCRPDDLEMYNIRQTHTSINDTIILKTSVYYTHNYNEHDGFFNVGRKIYGTVVKTTDRNELQELRKVEGYKAEIYAKEESDFKNSELQTVIKHQ